MTTIAGFRDKTGLVGIGSDTGVTGSYHFHVKTGKLWQLGQLTVGFAGIAPPISLRRKKYPATVAGITRLARDFRAAMDGAGHGTATEEGVKVTPLSAIIVGPNFGPYLLTEYFEAIEVAEPYAAVGSGCEIAMGAMHIATAAEIGTEDALAATLAATCAHDPFSSDPCEIVLCTVKKRKRGVPNKVRRDTLDDSDDDLDME